MIERRVPVFVGEEIVLFQSIVIVVCILARKAPISEERTTTSWDSSALRELDGLMVVFMALMQQECILSEALDWITQY